MKLLLSSMLALAIAGSPLRTQEPDEKDKPKQQEPKKQPEPKAKPAQEPDDKSKSKPKPKQEPTPPSRQQPDERQQKPQKEQAKNEKSRPPQEQTAPQNYRRQQMAGKGQRIPQEKFRASFGREHHFRVARGGGDKRRFEYSGYWFEVVEVWPAGWSFDDDCYIEEDGDDYYLVDVVRPEIRVLVIVVSA